MWDCGMLSDPRMPDTMEDDTPCPCFILDDRYKVDIYGDSYCPHCGCELFVIKNMDNDIGQDGYNYFEDIMECETCGKKYYRTYATRAEIDFVELRSEDDMDDIQMS